MDRRAGFTLIELLVVVAIIGIIATIAIPSYALHKRRAVDSQMVAVLASARNAMEAFYGSNNYSYSGILVSDLEADPGGYRATAGVDLEIVTASDSSYQIRACATGGTAPSMFFDSEAGKTNPDAGSCP